MTEATVHIVVSAVIEHTNGTILLAKRSPHKLYPSLWEDVGGGLEAGESPEEGLLREIREETGIEDIEIIKPLSVFHFFHGAEKDTKLEVLGLTYWCRTESQTVVLSDEHESFKWVTLEEASDYPLHEALEKVLSGAYLREKRREEKVLVDLW